MKKEPSCYSCNNPDGHEWGKNRLVTLVTILMVMNEERTSCYSCNNPDCHEWRKNHLVTLVTILMVCHEWGKNRTVTLVTILMVMNEERTGLSLRQTVHISGHLWHRYSVIFIGSVASLLAVTMYEGILIGTTSSGISDQLRDIYSTCRCYWNVATHSFLFGNTL